MYRQSGDEELENQLKESQLRVMAAKNGGFRKDFGVCNSNDYSERRISHSNTMCRRKTITKYTFMKPTKYCLTPLKQSLAKSVAENNNYMNLNEEFKNSMNHKGLVQLSYIDSKPIQPYISLKSIDELYDSLQEKVMRNSIFIRNSNKDYSLDDFMNFFCNRWIKTTEIMRPKQKSKIKKYGLDATQRSIEDRNSVLVFKANRSKLENFTDCVELYKETELLKKIKYKIDINELRKKGYLKVMNEIYKPTATELNTVSQIKDTFKKYYLGKQRLHNDILNKLESSNTERLLTEKIKRNCINQSIKKVEKMKYRDFSERISISEINCRGV